MSFKEGQHPLFQYTLEEKREILKEIGVKETMIQEDIDAIYDWFQKQPHLVDAGIDRDFIERMLIIAKGSREKTKRRIDNFYKYKAYAPDLIQSRERPLSGQNGEIWTFFRQGLMPKLYQGKRITVVEFSDPDPSTFYSDVLFRNALMIGDLRLHYDCMVGDIWLMDFKNTGFGHLLRMNPIVMQKASQIFQDGVGIKIFAIHVVNAPSFGQQILTFLKQFVKPKILDRIVIHDTLEDLHKHLPREYLPEEYGGTQPPMEVIKEKLTKELRSKETKELLLKCCKQISDENKRPNGREEYMVGSFKKLDFD